MRSGGRGVNGVRSSPLHPFTPSPLHGEVYDTPTDAIRENLGQPHRAPGDAGDAGGAVYRSTPDPRGDLAAGVHPAARARPEGAPPRPDAGDDGPLDSDHAARRRW